MQNLRGCSTCCSIRTEPFISQLKRTIMPDDIEMLLSVRLKESHYFIEKNKEDIDRTTELEEVEKHLKALKDTPLDI